MLLGAWCFLCYFICVLLIFYFFFFSSRRRHTRCSRDWSSDVCSSDLDHPFAAPARPRGAAGGDAQGRRRGGRWRGWEAVVSKEQQAATVTGPDPGRSEERRVGKECRSRWAPYH